MKLNIKTTNITLSESIEDYLRKKLMTLDKLVEFDRDNVYLQAELGRTTHHHKAGEIFRAEVNLHIGGKAHRAVAEAEDLYAAIDQMKDELARVVREGKEKRISIVRRGAQKLKDLLRFGRRRNGN